MKCNLLLFVPSTSIKKCYTPSKKLLTTLPNFFHNYVDRQNEEKWKNKKPSTFLAQRIGKNKDWQLFWIGSKKWQNKKYGKLLAEKWQKQKLTVFKNGKKNGKFRLSTLDHPADLWDTP